MAALFPYVIIPGCVHFTNQTHQCDVKILILLYMADKKSYYGFVPNDQTGYVEKLRRVIQQSKITQFSQNQQGGPPLQQQQQQQQQMPQQQQQQPGPRPMGPMGNMQPNPMAGNQNVGNMMGPQGDSGIMFNQQMQMQGNQSMVANQQRMARPNMMQNNNLRHLLQQQQTQFRPQMGGVQQQQQQQQMQGGRPGFDGMDQQYDMNFPM
jgi:mediator of RNA polymerase II transcription subunit 25